MRIAVYHNLPSGGAKRALAETVRRMAQRHEIDVFTLSSADHEFADLRPFVRRHQVYDFAPGRLFGSPWGRLNQAVRLRDLARLDKLTRGIAADIDAEGYDVLFANPCRFENSPSLLRHVQRTLAVYYCQEPLRRLYEPMPARPYDGAESRPRRLLNQIDPLPALYHRTVKDKDRGSLRAAARVLVNSHYVRQTVAEIYGVQAAVSYLGVDVGRFRPGDAARERFVLSVGSLTPLKGFDFLARALAELPVEERPTLVIASNFQNPPEREYILTLAGELGVRLELLAGISDDALVDLYRRAALVVYAPIREPFGLVPLEAMACATPVVSVREGGTGESIVDGETGFLVERDPARFAAAVRQILADPARAAAMGQAGRTLVIRRWSWECATETLEQHLTACLAQQPAQELAPVGD